MSTGTQPPAFHISRQNKYEHSRTALPCQHLPTQNQRQANSQTEQCNELLPTRVLGNEAHFTSTGCPLCLERVSPGESAVGRLQLGICRRPDLLPPLLHYCSVRSLDKLLDAHRLAFFASELFEPLWLCDRNAEPCPSESYHRGSSRQPDARAQSLLA